MSKLSALFYLVFSICYLLHLSSSDLATDNSFGCNCYQNKSCICCTSNTTLGLLCLKTIMFAQNNSIGISLTRNNYTLGMTKVSVFTPPERCSPIFNYGFISICVKFDEYKRIPPNGLRICTALQAYMGVLVTAAFHFSCLELDFGADWFIKLFQT